jgi:hypothetical protein
VSCETLDQARGSRPDPVAATQDTATQPPGAPPTDPLATKGDEVEEWLDMRFFRPIGARITSVLYPTKVTPDQVTLISVVIGLVAGHLFVYTSPWVNAAGFALFIVSDLFDSADGQLARRRGTSTRLGRALDGTSDGLRFLNLGVHLVVRLVLYSGWSWPAAVLLAVIASFSHTSQSATVDFVRHAFLALGKGKGSELDVDEVEVPADISPGYSRRRSHWCAPREPAALPPESLPPIASGCCHCSRGAPGSARTSGSSCWALPL